MDSQSIIIKRIILKRMTVEGLVDSPCSSFPWKEFVSHPRYWALLIFIPILKLLTLLPFDVIVKVGSVFGEVLLLAAKKIKKVSRVNVRLCFPDMCSDQCRCFVRASILELGVSLFETFYVWFGDLRKIRKDELRYEGMEHWHDALNEDKGVIILACHFGSQDLNVALLNSLDRQGRTLSFTYKKPSDKVIDNFLCTARSRLADDYFSVVNLLGICRALKNKALVWYAPDIESSKKACVFAKFMGVEAATSSAIGRLASSTGAAVLPFIHWRDDSGVYTLRFLAALEDFPLGDSVLDAQRVNDTIEELIQVKPEAYLWSIKRFRYGSDGPTYVYK